MLLTVWVILDTLYLVFFKKKLSWLQPKDSSYILQDTSIHIALLALRKQELLDILPPVKF